jgi:hypothetical protein
MVDHTTRIVHFTGSSPNTPIFLNREIVALEHIPCGAHGGFIHETGAQNEAL